MTKLFKKSLALLLTLALCLSAMACCFLVSAEGETTPAGSISFVLADETKTEINPGDNVIIDVVANWTGVAGAEFTVTGIPADATVATTNTEVVINHDAAAATVKFVDGNNAELANGVLFSISFTAGKAGDSYTFEIADGSVFCNLAEEDVTVTSEATSFTVVEKQVEPEVCAHVKDAAAYVANETTGCYDSVVKCALCGEEMIQIETTIPSTTPITTLIAPTTYLNVSDSVGIMTMFKQKEAANYASVSIRYTRTATDANYDLVYEYDEAVDLISYGSKTKYWVNVNKNIGLYEMYLPLTISVCCYDADGNLVAVTAPYVTTVTDEAWIYYNNETEDANKSLYVDLVNMGTDSQTYFVNEYGNVDGKICGLSNVKKPNTVYPFDQSLATKEVPSYSDDLANTAHSAVTVGGKSCSLVKNINLSGAAPYLQYMIKNGSKVTDPSLWSVEFSYTDGYDALQTKSMSGVFAEGSNPNGLVLWSSYMVASFAPALYDSDKVVSAVIKYGDTVVYTDEYCVDAWLAVTLPTLEVGSDYSNMANSIAKFTVCARNYFFG